MTTKQQYKAYASATQTVAPTKQIVLLYDGAVRFLKQAREAMQEKRIEDRYRLLVKATDVLAGLQGCLDFENGGQVARVLYQFYTMMELRIFNLHHTGSVADCEEIIAELKQMRDVWHEIDRGTAAEAAPGEPVADAQPAGGFFDAGDGVTISV